MQTVLNIVNFIVANYQAILSGLIAMLSGMVAISMVIPGDQPEKFLQSVVDFISKFSRK